MRADVGGGGTARMEGARKRVEKAENRGKIFV